MRRFVLGAVLLIAALPALAASPLKGFVIDKTNGEPLPVANVSVYGTNRGATTNLDGFFLIPAMEPGTYTLEASYLGYHPTTLEITLDSSRRKSIRIELTPAAVHLEEVVYTVDDANDKAKRTSPRVSTVPVDAVAIRKMPALGAEMDVLRAVQAIPGVKASSEVNTAPHVRGGSPDMTLILMDQSTVYNPSHMFGLFSTFNGDAVKRLELMKGGFPAEYGGRAGSVLEVVTNDGNRRETEGLVSLGIVSARGALEGPLGKDRGSYAIAGRRTYFEPLLNAIDGDAPDYYFYDGNGKVNFDITKQTTLTIGGYLGLDQLDFEFGSDDARAKVETYWGNRTSTARLRQVVGDASYMTVSGAWSRYRSGAEFWDKDEKTGNDKLIQDFKNRFNDLNVRLDWEYYGHRDHKIKTGLSASNYDVYVRNTNEDTDYVSIDTSSTTYAHYIQDQWRLHPMFEILPGLRSYYREVGDKKFFFDPRLALVVHADTNMRFKLAGGRYHQFVNVISAGDGLSFFDIWIPQDGSVDPTYLDQIVFGWEWDFKPQYEFTFETYYSDMNNILEQNQSIDEGETVRDAFLSGKGYSYGFEWMLRKKSGRLTGWLGYSLSWSKRRFPGTYLNEGDWYYPKWDRRHDFVFVGAYQLSKSWDISAQWRYNTGQGYTQGVGIYTNRYYNVDPERTSSNGRELLYGRKNNYRFPADHRLDLSANYSHKFFGLPAKLTLSVYNAYNRKAIFMRNYETDDNPVTYEDIKLLPVLPLLSYEVRF